MSVFDKVNAFVIDVFFFPHKHAISTTHAHTAPPPTAPSVWDSYETLASGSPFFPEQKLRFESVFYGDRAPRRVRMLESALLILLAGLQCASEHTDTLVPPELSQHNGTLYASCKVRPSTSLPEGLPKVYGQVLFKQELQGKLQVLLRFSGFPTTEGPPQPRAVHIHQYGDLGRGCDSTGGHYNPSSVNHPNHPGDFGNFVAQQGKIIDQRESEATLFGGLSVIGRAVVVHERIDDLGSGGDAGSLLHGNAGRRLACCIIGMSSPSLWSTQHKVYMRGLRRN